MSELGFRRMFLIGALWNVGGGVFIVAAAGWIFSAAGLAPPDPPVYFHSWIALFMVLGAGYYMVYRNLYGNRDIVVLGIIGKLAFSVIFITDMIVFRGQIPLFFLIPVIGDLVFVALFWMFLRFAGSRGK